MRKKERGRPMASYKVRLAPVFREAPDMEKLRQALISNAISIAEKKEAEVESYDSDTASEKQPTEGRAA